MTSGLLDIVTANRRRAVLMAAAAGLAGAFGVACASRTARVAAAGSAAGYTAVRAISNT